MYRPSMTPDYNPGERVMDDAELKSLIRPGMMIQTETAWPPYPYLWVMWTVLEDGAVDGFVKRWDAADCMGYDKRGVYDEIREVGLAKAQPKLLRGSGTVAGGIYSVRFDTGWQSTLNMEFSTWKQDGDDRFVIRVKNPVDPHHRMLCDFRCWKPSGSLGNR